MQEFSSVTASSYDADSLAPLLSEKAAEGWSVVSIVSAGTNIVAYLSREADGSTTAATGGTAGESEAHETESTATESTATEAPAETPAEQPLAATGTAVAASAVDEPAGWASAPEETAPAETATPEPAAEPAADDSIASLAEQVGAESTAAAAEPETPAAAEPETPAAAAEPAVPAGWYADPSGRFELRYWDGTAWTEHVSRAGQQFTDPPVA